MKLQKLVLSSILLALGLVLHLVTPPIFANLKPDFLLAMMFIAISICDDYKSTIVIGVVAGVLTALTTGFPGGQLPNIIDKFITANVVFLANKYLGKFVNKQIKMFLISFVGTIISGAIFLTSALLIVGLPGAFLVLFSGVFVAAIVNTVVVIVFYNATEATMKKSSAF